MLTNTLTYQVTNYSLTEPAQIRSFTFSDYGNVSHHADLSNFGLSSDFTGNTSISTATHNYVTGSPLRKTSVSVSFPVDKTITADNIGTTLQLNNTTGLSTKAGWIATSDDGAYDGSQYIVSVTSATWVEMSAGPLFAPTIGGSITFSSTVNEIVMDNTAGLQAGWTITGNGYTSGMGAYIIEVVGDNATLIVDQLPSDTLWSVSGLMVFTTSTKFLTLDSTSGLSAGWFATNNGYDGTQYIVSIDGNTLTMSDYPGGYPTVGAITFSNASTTLVTISPGQSKYFDLKYDTITTTVGTWTSLLTVTANQGTPVVKQVKNYILITRPGQSPTQPPPPENRIDIGVAGGGGSRVQVDPGDGGSVSIFGNFIQTGGEKASETSGGLAATGWRMVTEATGSGYLQNDSRWHTDVNLTGESSFTSVLSLKPGVVTFTYVRYVWAPYTFTDPTTGLTVTQTTPLPEYKQETYETLGTTLINVAKVIAFIAIPGSYLITKILVKLGVIDDPFKVVDLESTTEEPQPLTTDQVIALVEEQIKTEDEQAAVESGTGSTDTFSDVPADTDGGWNSTGTDPYGGDQGDGGACYLAGAKIAMADGRSINIEDVKVGEFVLGAFGEINQVLALKHVTLGIRKLYKINQEHDTTHEEIHISSDKNMYSIDTDATYGEYGLYWKCISGDGTEEMIMNFGVSKERLRTLHEGVELQSINGPLLLTSIEEYDLPEDTKLYNFVLNGSHTFFVNGYAVASFPREDDFDYDQWKSKVN